ncbi:MAG: DUF1329 domain-containing protein, partial [Stenotrophobium sp.]
MSTLKSGAALAVALGIFTVQAYAEATPAEAAKLCHELTCIGALQAGNADGTIPAWTGPSNFSEEQKHYTVADLEKLRKDHPEALQNQLEKQAGKGASTPEFTITKANMAKYQAHLTEGQRAMLEMYPTYKMIVYKTIRDAFYPDAIYKATVANATRATLTGTDTITGAKLGFPFPIPKNGAEVIWNHKLAYRGIAVRRFNNQAIVKPDGTFTITKIIEDVKFKYADIEHPGDGKLFAYYLSTVVSPPRVAGQITLVHETAGGGGTSRQAWIFSPGMGRVNRAPDVGYDNPAIGTDNEQYNDQIDVFNGALDRYNWKLLGKKEIYIPYNSYKINSPLIKYKQILTPFHVNQDYERYELHRVWVVEATLKPGMRHNFAKRVFYVDEDSWSIAAVDCYDNRGALWKVQEADLLSLPFIPTTTGIPEIIYDLQSHRYFVTAMVNE